jgi:hypothetical protein
MIKRIITILSITTILISSISASASTPEIVASPTKQSKNSFITNLGKARSRQMKARTCIDYNLNGKCDSNEPTVYSISNRRTIKRSTTVQRPLANKQTPVATQKSELTATQKIAKCTKSYPAPAQDWVFIGIGAGSTSGFITCTFKNVNTGATTSSSVQI